MSAYNPVPPEYEVPPKAGPNGRSLGARKQPSCLSKFCVPACAISGYEYGDLYEGICEGQARCALLLEIFCCFIAGFYVLFAWKPEVKNIKGDGAQRTVKNRCCAALCVGGACTIGFWETGDACTGCCHGDALIALLLTVILEVLCGISCVGECFACCCWTPNKHNFLRDSTMDGGGAEMVGNNAPAPVVVGQAVVVGVAR